MYNHKKALSWAQLKVGVVVTTALVVLFITVLFAGNIGELFAPKTKIHATFKDVKGLRRGAPVWFSSIEIGSVRSLEFIPQQKIMITMAIKPETIKYIRKNSVATILTLGLLGDKYVEISPGSKDSPLIGPNGTITGLSQIELKDIVETSQESIRKISDFVSMLEEILKKIEGGKGTVAKFLKDPAIYDNLQETAENLNKLSKNLTSGTGTAGKLLTDDTLYLDLSASAKDVRLFTSSLKESEGTVYKLIKDPALYDSFLSASTSLQRFAEDLEKSEGSLKKFIEDKSLYENINSVTRKMDIILSRIDRGEGLMGSLLTEDKLTTELKNTLDELNKLIRDIRKNPHKYFKFSIF